jgi:hypothetical protein
MNIGGFKMMKYRIQIFKDVIWMGKFGWIPPEPINTGILWYVAHLRDITVDGGFLKWGYP